MLCYDVWYGYLPKEPFRIRPWFPYGCVTCKSEMLITKFANKGQFPLETLNMFKHVSIYYIIKLYTFEHVFTNFNRVLYTFEHVQSSISRVFPNLIE